MQNDFKARLDWCITDKRADANHSPVVHCQGDATQNVLRINTAAGSTVALDAGGTTDPDGNELAYRWFVYPEPGTYRGDVAIREADGARAEVLIPADAAGKTMHILLQVTDDGSPPLTRYRRVVLTAR